MSRLVLAYIVLCFGVLSFAPQALAQAEEGATGGCVDSDGCPVICWKADEQAAQSAAAQEISDNFRDPSPPTHAETSCISDYSQMGLEVSADLLRLPSLSELFGKAKDAACDATDSYLQSLVRRSGLAMDLPLGGSIDLDLYNGGGGVDVDLDWGDGIQDVLEDEAEDIIDDIVEDVIEDPLDDLICWKLPKFHPRYCGVGDDINDIW